MNVVDLDVVLVALLAAEMTKSKLNYIEKSSQQVATSAILVNVFSSTKPRRSVALEKIAQLVEISILLYLQLL